MLNVQRELGIEAFPDVLGSFQRDSISVKDERVIKKRF